MLRLPAFVIIRARYPIEMTEPSTPLMRQYASIKKEHPAALLFFRLGDFYELFFDDAVLASRELQITLTSRNKEKGLAVPMCGVPYHAADGYISKLVRKGFQGRDLRADGRSATRQETGATRGDAGRHSRHCRGFFSSVRKRIIFWPPWHRVAIAPVLQRSIFRPANSARPSFKGRMRNGESRKSCNSCVRKKCSMGPPHRSLIGNIRAIQSRLLVRSDMPRLRSTTGYLLPTTRSRCWKIISECLSLEGFGLAGKPAAASAAGAIIYYVRSTQRGTLSHVDRVGFYERQNCLILDTVTVRNLELIEPLFAGTDAGVTLLRSIDATVTPMGKAAVALVAAASVNRVGGNKCPIGCGRDSGKRHSSPRRIAARIGRHPRSRTFVEPCNA